MGDSSGTPISPVGVSKPELTISSPSINNEPVELDGTPASPEKVRNSRRASKADNLSELRPEEREERERLIHERKNDAAVLVDLPQTPGAEEFNKSADAEASVSSKTLESNKS